MEEKKIKEAADKYVSNHQDSEVRRMYGHHYRSFMAGVSFMESQLTEKDLDMKLLKVDRDHEKRLRESCEKALEERDAEISRLNGLIDKAWDGGIEETAHHWHMAEFHGAKCECKEPINLEEFKKQNNL
jgi:hypothetical protein